MTESFEEWAEAQAEELRRMRAEDVDDGTPIDDLQDSILVSALTHETIIYHEGRPYVDWGWLYGACHVVSRAFDNGEGLPILLDEVSQVVIKSMKVAGRDPQE